MTKKRQLYNPLQNSNNETLRVRSGWPVSCQIIYGNKGHIVEYTMKEDMRLFNITDKQLAEETNNINHKRIYNIKHNFGSPASMKELSILTLAFNRIIEKRLRTGYKINVFEGSELNDNQSIENVDKI